MARTSAIRGSATTVLMAALLASMGCHHVLPSQIHGLPASEVTAVSAPRELYKGILPEYRIEPPDVLMIDAVHIVPGAAYRLRTMDTLAINVGGTLPDDPIDGVFPVEPGGMVCLGASYGRVKVSRMATAQAQAAIREHLLQYIKSPSVTLSLASTGTTEQIAGQHLVAPDGRVTLGSYGRIQMVGLTMEEAKRTIEAHLSQWLEDPEVVVDVFGYNSKIYYVITQGAGLGDNVYSFPITGNETVLDALAQINGLTQVSSKRIWIARPGKGHDGCGQLFPVDWQGITEMGNAATNYQVLPGDRVYVAEDRLIAFDNHLARIIAPFERLMGFTLLGTQTVTRLSGKVLQGGGDRGRFGGTIF
jgi:polysaccharide export outer membrane protein